jgi:GT2 family glycosyltransferase
MKERIGVVAIGRNEGECLKLCLASVAGLAEAVVYVDSGSSDGSVTLARSMGVEVVELDLSTPFTAARARNAGAERLHEIAPDISLVQFVDGDCEIVPGWLDRAEAEFHARPGCAVVCGRVRERHPERSVYNRLADLEWDTPTGDVKACGGICLIRSEAFQQVGGYNASIVAAEDNEICLRLRGLGWTILKVDAEMATHDMAMTHFGQWWRRSIRTGYAFADGASRHGKGPERHFVRQTRGTLAWGIALPALALVAAWPTHGLSLLAVPMAYLAQAARIQSKMRRIGQTPHGARDYALFCMIGKIPQAVGIVRHAADRLAGRQGRIIEHKRPSTTNEPASPLDDCGAEPEARLMTANAGRGS